MDNVSIMDKLPAMGTQIFDVLMPTVKLFTPELVRNKSLILSTPRVEHVYGPHPRQKLDLYTSTPNSPTAPILIFLYGGGLIRGDKIMPPFLVPDGLVYHNIGSFFAQRGLTTIIADYRRVNTPDSGEDAVFPSGGEDVSLVLKWLEDYLKTSGSEKRDVFLLGNSAGGIHMSTFLLEERWALQRSELASEAALGKLRAAVLVGVPYHFDGALDVRADPMMRYYGSAENYKKLSPYGLLKSAIEAKGSPKNNHIPDLLAFTVELDPAEEIVKPNEDFVALWEKGWGKDGLEYRVVAKHNHISPTWTLGTGDDVAEKWGVDIVKWIDARRERL